MLIVTKITTDGVTVATAESESFESEVEAGAKAVNWDVADRRSLGFRVESLDDDGVVREVFATGKAFQKEG